MSPRDSASISQRVIYRGKRQGLQLLLLLSAGDHAEVEVFCQHYGSELKQPKPMLAMCRRLMKRFSIECRHSNSQLLKMKVSNVVGN
jgi:hypothetical protein